MALCLGAFLATVRFLVVLARDFFRGLEAGLRFAAFGRELTARALRALDFFPAGTRPGFARGRLVLAVLAFPLACFPWDFGAFAGLDGAGS